MAKYKDTIKYFVEEAKKDFSVVEKNLEKIIKEVKESQEKGLNYIKMQLICGRNQAGHSFV